MKEPPTINLSFSFSRSKYSIEIFSHLTENQINELKEHIESKVEEILHEKQSNLSLGKYPQNSASQSYSLFSQSQVGSLSGENNHSSSTNSSVANSSFTNASQPVNYQASASTYRYFQSSPSQSTSQKSYSSEYSRQGQIYKSKQIAELRKQVEKFEQNGGFPELSNFFQIQKIIGKGGQGHVFKAHSNLYNQCAIKMISLSKIEDSPKTRDKFIKYLTLKHQNIIQHHEFFISSEYNSFVTVLEYCSEGNLVDFMQKSRKLLSQKKLTSMVKNLQLCDDPEYQEFVDDFLSQVKNGLKNLHSNGIIHQDIKLENILLTKDKRTGRFIVKIADLDLAVHLEAKNKLEYESGEYSPEWVTKFYVSPEFHKTGKYKQASDVWALGIVGIELKAGQRIFTMTKKQDPAKMSEIELIQLIKKNVKESGSQNQLIKMLDKNPQSRYKLQKDQTVNYVNKNEQIEYDSPKDVQNFISQLDRGTKFQCETIKFGERTFSDEQFIKIVQKSHLFPKLKSLHINDNGIADEGFKEFGRQKHKFKYLEVIYLNNNLITDESVIQFVDQEEACPNLNSIQLKGNKITDKGLIAVANKACLFPNLHQISLQGNQITIAGIKKIAEKSKQFKMLSFVYFSRNGIREKELQEARTINPSLHIQIEEEYSLNYY